VRPLISTADTKKSVDISRKAELFETSSGLITITGGKLTTWRRMAKLAVDRMVEREGREAPCRTQEIPLGLAVSPESLPAVEGVSEASYAALAQRYGHAAHDVLRLAAAAAAAAAAGSGSGSGSGEDLTQPILAGAPDLLAEVAHAARHEQVRSVGDVLLRRTRLGLIAGRELCEERSEVPSRVARALAGELGWDEARVERETARFGAEAAAEGIVPLAVPPA